MKPNWKPTTNKDTLQQFQMLNDKYNKLCTNYNGLTEKHRIALEKIKTLECIEEDNKTLRNAITVKNRKIKSLEDSRKHLKERFGVK